MFFVRNEIYFCGINKASSKSVFSVRLIAEKKK